MTFRRPLSVFALSLIIAATSFAATSQKRRAVTPAVHTAILSGTILDAATGQPVPDVNVSRPGHSGRTDAQGKFAMQLPTGVDQVLEFSRTGYATLNPTVNITADATQTFQLTPKPTVRVRMTDGTTYDLDTESLEFGYSAPFSGYTKDTKMNLCKSGGASFQPERSEIKHITSASPLTDATCCAQGPIPAINVELKTGGTTMAGFTDACFGYKVDIIALEHTKALPVYLHFSDIAEVTFP